MVNPKKAGFRLSDPYMIFQSRFSHIVVFFAEIVVENHLSDVVEKTGKKHGLHVHPVSGWRMCGYPAGDGAHAYRMNPEFTPVKRRRFFAWRCVEDRNTQRHRADRRVTQYDNGV